MSEKHIGVAGATGALGKEIVALLDRAPWKPRFLVPLARASSSTAFVSFRDENVAVDNLDEQVMDELDLLVIATPVDAARAAGERAVAAGVPVVDCSGAFAQDDDVPLVVPWINPVVLEEGPSRAVYAVPSAETVLLASVLGPLIRAGLVHEAEAQLLVPASAWGRAGIEELSSQIIAMFNSGTPPRKIFERGLAFDLLPAVGELDATGWSSLERRVPLELQALLEVSVEVTAVAVPVFSGTSAMITVELAKRAPVDLISRVLSDGGVTVAADERSTPRPRSVQTHPFAHVGRIREGTEGRLHLWACLDNLVGVGAVAVSLAGALLRD